MHNCCCGTTMLLCQTQEGQSHSCGAVCSTDAEKHQVYRNMHQGTDDVTATDGYQAKCLGCSWVRLTRPPQLGHANLASAWSQHGQHATCPQAASCGAAIGCFPHTGQGRIVVGTAAALCPACPPCAAAGRDTNGKVPGAAPTTCLAAKGGRISGRPGAAAPALGATGCLPTGGAPAMLRGWATRWSALPNAPVARGMPAPWGPAAAVLPGWGPRLSATLWAAAAAAGTVTFLV